ncbi:hypothetical protein PM082_024091 [Marasmius tenuissimus]|nr:hypothetical protein PM082_024091 [Marasmius tenuissimus]
MAKGSVPADKQAGPSKGRTTSRSNACTTQPSEDEDDVAEVTETTVQGQARPSKAPSKTTKRKQTEVPLPEPKTKHSGKKPVQAPQLEPPPPKPKCNATAKKPERPPSPECPQPVPKPTMKAQKTLQVVSPEIQQDGGSSIEVPHADLLSLNDDNDPDNPFLDCPGNKDISFVLVQGVNPYEEEKLVAPEFFDYNDSDVEVVEEDGTQVGCHGQAAISSDKDGEGEDEDEAEAEEVEETRTLSDAGRLTKCFLWAVFMIRQPESYATPGCKKKKKPKSPQAKAAARKRNQVNRKKKKVTFQEQEDLGSMVAAVSGSSDNKDIGVESVDYN